jgi:hypothetical protein
VADLHDQVSTVMSFTRPNLSLDDIFPLQVTFREDYSALDLKAASVQSAVEGDDTAYSHKISYKLQTDQYRVEND